MATWAQYEKKMQTLENEGISTSDAQGIVDMEFNDRFGLGWERNA